MKTRHDIDRKNLITIIKFNIAHTLDRIYGCTNRYVFCPSFVANENMSGKREGFQCDEAGVHRAMKFFLFKLHTTKCNTCTAWGELLRFRAVGILRGITA